MFAGVLATPMLPVVLSQSTFTCSKLIIETLEEGVKIASKLTPSSSVFIINFENVIAGWAI